MHGFSESIKGSPRVFVQSLSSTFFINYDIDNQISNEFPAKISTRYRNADGWAPRGGGEVRWGGPDRGG